MSRRTSRYSLAAEAALAALVVFCPLALGGAPKWTLWPLVLLSGAAAVLAAVGARRQGQLLHIPLLALPLFGGALLCAAQLVPLPPGALAALSPEAAALREYALVPLGLDAPRPLSLDPSATWRELARHVAYLLAFTAAVQVCRSRRARRRLLSVVALTGAGLAVLGLAHQLLGVTHLLGLRAFAHAQPPLVTPFGNPNHLAGFLGLSATLAVGLALASEQRHRLFLYGSAALLSGAGVLLSLSRGGIAFFVLGQLVLALAVLWRRQGPRGRLPVGMARGGAVVLGLLAVLAVGGYVGTEKLAAELASANSVEKLRHSKVDLWPMMASAARAFPVLGMGRGAFEAAFPRYQTAYPIHTFTHPENAVLQLAAEFGVPGLALLALALWAFARLLRREGLGPVELAALAGVGALALHNLFDFSLEYAACAVAALVSLAAVARPEESSAGEAAPRGLRPARALAGSAALTVLALGALVPGRHTLERAEAELTALVAARSPLAEVRARGQALIDRHPSDYLLYALVAHAATAEGKASAGEALAFINRALFLRPLDATSHRTAARALLTLGRRAQGFLEYRLAHEAGDMEVLRREALPRARTLEELWAMTPDSAGVAVLLAEWLGSRPEQQELSLAYLARARERFAEEPGVAALWEAEARLRLARREVERAEAACVEVEKRAPEALRTHLLRADVLRAQGRGPEALQSLERLVARFPGNVDLAFALAGQCLDAGMPRRAREVLQQASPFLTDFGQRARLLSVEGSTYEREGLYSRAIERYQSAARLSPTPDAHFAVARLYEALRRPEAAVREVREGLRLLPAQGRAHAEAWVARLESEEKKRIEAQRQRLQDDPEEQELEFLRQRGAESGTP
ncbi:O-antigen ligase family protein [Myxococcaceae bacterium GXIMD 01537]